MQGPGTSLLFSIFCKLTPSNYVCIPYTVHSIDQVTRSVMFEFEIKQNNSVYFGLTNTAYTVTLYRGTI